MLIAPLPHRVQEVEVNGKSPFREWLRKLKDAEAAAAVVSRLRRIEMTGGFGTYRYLADGIFELKFKIGPGYRVYFGLQQGSVGFFFWLVEISQARIGTSERPQNCGRNT